MQCRPCHTWGHGRCLLTYCLSHRSQLKGGPCLHPHVLHCIAHSAHGTKLNILVHCTALFYTALRCTALHCTALHCIALNCYELHCTLILLYCELQCTLNVHFMHVLNCLNLYFLSTLPRADWMHWPQWYNGPTVQSYSTSLQYRDTVQPYSKALQYSITI